MTDPALVMRKIDSAADVLDAISNTVDLATEEYLAAEEAWFEVYDPIADSLKEDMAEEGRKGDPAEHTIVREARKANRVAWARYRRAKKNLDALTRRQEASSKALSGWQSELKALTAEASLGSHDRPATHTYGRRAA